MRTAFGGGVVENDEGQFLGVYLGTDGCAEHEWGIKDLRHAFGMRVSEDDRSVLGVERRKVTQLPNDLVMLDKLTPIIPQGMKGKKNLAAYQRGYLANEYLLVYEHLHSREHAMSSAAGHTDGEGAMKAVHGAWDERSFAFAADKDIISELNSAFYSLDIMMMVGGSGPFGGGPGLSFAIYSRIPQSVKDAQKAADEERFWLLDWEAATGVLEKIKQSDKIQKGSWRSAYFACSAKKWRDGVVKWWLNPCDQFHNEANWYTTEELEQWCEGKGPVVTNSHAAKGLPR